MGKRNVVFVCRMIRGGIPRTLLVSLPMADRKETPQCDAGEIAGVQESK